MASRKRTQTHRVVTLGGDCDGICSAAIAMELTLGSRSAFKHVFASELCSATRSLLVRNHDIEKVYTDVMKRDHNTLPCVDCYTSGPPCQPFSLAGLQRGLSDERVGPLLEVVNTIMIMKPHCFILEEVPALVNKFPNILEDVLGLLGGIRDSIGRAIYTVDASVIDSLECGLPQRRRRLYIVGWKNSLRMPGLCFSWPSKLKQPCLDAFLSPVDATAEPELPLSKTGLSNLTALLESVVAAGIDWQKKTVCLDIGSSRNRGKQYAVGVCQTLTRSRCGSLGYWLSKHQRFMTTDEMFKLQGVPAGRITRKDAMYEVKRGRHSQKKFKKIYKRQVSDRQVRLAIGNAMSVPAVGRILHSLLRLLGYIEASHPDPWLV